MTEAAQRLLHLGLCLVEAFRRGIVGRAGDVEIAHVPSREHVQVQMRDLDARDQQTRAGRVPRVPNGLSDPLGDGGQLRELDAVHVLPVVDLLAGHDKRVAGSDRGDGQKSDDVVVFPDEPAGQPARDDRAEYRSHVPQASRTEDRAATVLPARPASCADTQSWYTGNWQFQTSGAAGWGGKVRPMNPQAGASTLPEEANVTRPVLDIVVPVYNEEADLAACVHRLHAHLREFVPMRARITIADNASTDATLEVANELADSYDDVQVVHLDRKGRGRALRAVWEASDAEVVAYMDVDLSTDLNALLPLVAPLVSGHSDIAIGTRLAKASRVVRGPKREFISRSYNLILRTSLRARFSDAQCGFKAMRSDVARKLLPLVEDGEWFFDTELLVIAERADLRIHEVPVDWVDDPDSRVDIADTARKDLRGIWRLGRALTTGALPLDDLRKAVGREPLVPGVPLGMVGQLVRFAIIGVLSTVAYALLYLALHSAVGPFAANFIALLVTAVANTAANRAFTFGVRGRNGVARHQLQGLLIFGFGLLSTSGSLLVLHAVLPSPSRHLDLIVLVVANLVATLTRFLGLRLVFRKAGAAEAAAQHRVAAAS